MDRKEPTLRPYELDVKKFICEVCDVTAEMTEKQAFDSGWDAMPCFSTHVKCGSCSVFNTAWGVFTLASKTVKKH